MSTRSERLIAAITESWSSDTTSTPQEWSTATPARGQCVPTALVIQDYLGGTIERLVTTYNGVRETYYHNLVDDIVIDVSRAQYPATQQFVPAPVDGDTREYVLANQDTRDRYTRLTYRVQELMYIKSMAEHPDDSSKPVVLFDMDGVMFDFDGRTEALLSEAGITIPERTTFYAADRLSDPDHIEYIQSQQRTKGFFVSLQPIPGAIEAWQFVQSLGFHPRICSAPISSNPWSIHEKLLTIEKYLGPRAADEAFIASDKTRCHGNILFDDRPEIDNANNASWIHAHFTQDYNKSIPDEYRIDTWSDTQRIRKVLSRAVANHSL